MISGATFPENSTLGLFLTKTADDAAYDTPYNNIKYTSSTSGGNQIWTASSSILLTGTKANVYAYYPYDDNFNDITKISIDVSENKDVMWATPATNVYNASPTAPLAMNHALSVIRFSLSKGDYSGAGSIESITIQGDCMAKTGTLNAKTGDVIISDAGAEIDFGTLGAAANLSPTATTVEQLVIPTTTSGPIKVTIKMDGKTFEATSSASVGTEKSKAYKFGLAFSDSKLTMSTVSIGTITEVQGEDMTPIDKTITTWAQAKNIDGVYAIKADGSPMPYSEASTTSETLSGVAIVMYGRALQISNKQADTRYWGNNSTNISGIPDVTQTGGGVTNNYGYLPKPDNSYATSTESYKIKQPYTAWPTYASTALADTCGWKNTKALITAQGGSYIGGATTTFRNNSSVNQGYSDWIIPSAGQLAYIYLNVTNINTLLQKVTGATQISTSGWYASSSEYDDTYKWSVSFVVGNVSRGNKEVDCTLRFCRDITE